MALRDRHAGGVPLLPGRCEQHGRRGGHRPGQAVPRGDHAPHDRHLRPDSLLEGHRGLGRVADGGLRHAGGGLHEDVRGAGRGAGGAARQRTALGRRLPQVRLCLLRRHPEMDQVREFAETAHGDAAVVCEAGNLEGEGRRGDSRRGDHGQRRQCDDARPGEPHGADLQRLGRPPRGGRHHQLHERLQRPAPCGDVHAGDVEQEERLLRHPRGHRPAGQVDDGQCLLEPDREQFFALPVVQRCGGDVPARGNCVGAVWMLQRSSTRMPLRCRSRSAELRAPRAMRRARRSPRNTSTRCRNTRRMLRRATSR